MKKKIQDLLQLARDMIEEEKILEALEYLNSLEPVDEYTEQEKTVFYTLNSEIHFILNNYHKSYEYAEKGIQFAKKIDKGLEVVDALIRMGIILISMGKNKESIDYLEESSDILSDLTQVSEKDRKRRLGLILSYKGIRFYNMGESIKANEIFNDAIDLLKKWDSKANLATAYTFYGISIRLIGEFNKAQTFLSKSQKICENNESPVYNLPKLMNLIGFGSTYFFKGELQLGLEYTKKGISLARKYNNPKLMLGGLINLGSMYQRLGENEQAIKYLKEALPIAENFGRRYLITLGNFFSIYINMGDITKAKQVFHKIEQYQDKEKDNKFTNQLYRFCKAVLMKKSKRTRDLGVAQVIFKDIAQEELIHINITQWAILHFCEMLLDEFKETKNIEVIEEFSTFLNQLQNAAEKYHSYPILAETYLLEAKLNMINYDLKKSRQSLTKAQQIAERCGLNPLAIRISDEHDKLIQNLEVWKQMKEENVSVSERLEKVEISDQILRMLNKKPVVIPETTPESPILLLVMTNSGISIYTKIFNKEWEISENLCSSFLSAFNTFSKQIFSEGLDRANFGKYTILMTRTPPLIVCYVFEGQSFLAQQKFSKFIETLHESEQIWKKLTSSNRIGLLIKENAYEGLGKLVKTIF